MGEAADESPSDEIACFLRVPSIRGEAELLLEESAPAPAPAGVELRAFSTSSSSLAAMMGVASPAASASASGRSSRAGDLRPTSATSAATSATTELSREVTLLRREASEPSALLDVEPLRLRLLYDPEPEVPLLLAPPPPPPLELDRLLWLPESWVRRGRLTL